ncbi:L-glyceraldehyde 3-phosphate reductase [Corynebacterium occultum]|uniref:L-glyceraldehyde 3-phosphate reductase n=1 Tax=Corynebacterium occultum TaxID=2675219 RepID=A0A6B8VVI5_9CORY|nr:aldo/keto reductase [Corynebacterium occultum]QGU08153.1 L-glyceraldehyde 3-phosphate reductase [Corynebacterium occultum]
MSTNITIPRTDFKVFPLNLGANPFGWTSDRETTFAVLDAFLAAGGNFIDTADMYSVWVEGHVGGESEALIGEWLKERDAYDKVIIATKGGALEPNQGLERVAVFAAVDASRERLGLETIDIYYYHHDDENISIPEQVATAHQLIESGRIRHLALSNHSPERAREFFEASQGTPAQPVALQPQYNLLHRAEVEKGYGPLAQEYEAALLPYFSLASGMLTGKYRTAEDLSGSAREGFMSGYVNDAAFRVIDTLVEIADSRQVEPSTVALAWIIAKGITAPIASVSAPEQLPALLAAPTLGLSAAEVAALDEVSAGFAA